MIGGVWTKSYSYRKRRVLAIMLSNNYHQQHFLKKSLSSTTLVLIVVVYAVGWLLLLPVGVTGQGFDSDTVILSDIGEGENGLRCITTQTDCCGRNAIGMLVPNERRGEFYYPDGTPIPTRGDAGSDGLFRGRGHQFIVLQRMPTATTTPPIGRYHCIIPGNRFNVSFNFINAIITPSGNNTIGEEFNLTCTVTSKEASTIVWYAPGDVKLPNGVNDTRKVHDVMYTDTTTGNKIHSSVLLFDPLQASHEGIYACSIMVGTSTGTKIKQVNVKEPVITAMVNGGTQTIGESYSLTCTVIGADRLKPTITYQWFQDNIVVSDETQSTLFFSFLDLSDVGQYRCDVTVSSTLLNTSITAMSNTQNLTVQIPPPTAVTVTASPNGTTFTGSSITLTCTVELSEAVNIIVIVNTAWSGPPGTQFTNTNSVATRMTATMYTSTATISSVEISDAGEYTCTAIISSTSPFVISSSQVAADYKKIRDVIHMFQLRLVRTDDCITWNFERAMEIQSCIHKQMLQAITKRCQCKLPKENLLAGTFSCLESHNQTTYRSAIIGTQSYNATEFVKTIQGWVSSGPTLIIQWYTEKLDKNCPVSISSLDDPEC